MNPKTPIPKAPYAFSLFLGACSIVMGIFSRISQGDEGNSTFIAFMGLGMLFLLIGISTLILARKVAKNASEDLIAAGYYIMADVDRVLYAEEIDNREPVNSTHGIFHTPVEEDYDEDEEVLHPYIIFCHYTDERGRRTNYIVPNLWVDPAPYLQSHNNQVKVYIRKGHPDEYRFDLTEFEETPQ